MIRQQVPAGTRLGAAWPCSWLMVLTDGGLRPARRLGRAREDRRAPSAPRRRYEADTLFWKTLHAGSTSASRTRSPRSRPPISRIRATRSPPPTSAGCTSGGSASGRGWPRAARHHRRCGARAEVLRGGGAARSRRGAVPRLLRVAAHGRGHHPQGREDRPAGLRHHEDAVARLAGVQLLHRGLHHVRPARRLRPVSGGARDQWRNLDVCVGSSGPRESGLRALHAAGDREGPKRVCWNSWIAPHNFEGFFLNFGDMLVKAGQLDTAVTMYRNAQHAPRVRRLALQGRPGGPHPRRREERGGVPPDRARARMRPPHGPLDLRLHGLPPGVTRR